MEELKKLYFDNYCDTFVIKVSAKPEDKKKFFDAKISKHTLKKWADEYGELVYQNYLKDGDSFNSIEFHKTFQDIILCSPITLNTIYKILDILNKVNLDKLIIFYKDKLEIGTYFLMQFISDKKKDDFIGNVRYIIRGKYQGILPYLYKNKEYDLFNIILGKISYIIKCMGDNFFKDILESFLKENNIK